MLWPQLLVGRVDVVAVVTAVAAEIALFRFKVGATPMLGACAIAIAGTWVIQLPPLR